MIRVTRGLPANIFLFKVINKNTRNLVFSSIFIDDFEQVNVSWDTFTLDNQQFDFVT